MTNKPQPDYRAALERKNAMSLETERSKNGLPVWDIFIPPMLWERYRQCEGQVEEGIFICKKDGFYEVSILGFPPARIMVTQPFPSPALNPFDLESEK